MFCSRFLRHSRSPSYKPLPPSCILLPLSPSPERIYIHCNDAGAEFIEASSDLTIADFTKADVTSTVEQLYPLEGAANVEGNRLPLLVIQVTKLLDGISVGCTFNHAVADGTSYWHFFRSWAELCRGNGKISTDPFHDRCLIGTGLNGLLDIDPEGDIPRLCPPPLRVKIFHFTNEIVRGLKEVAKRNSPVPISSFQALCGHVWRAITRARRLGPDLSTIFRMPVNCRGRLVPPLPGSYFGNAIQVTSATATAGELMGNDLFFAARLLHDIIEGHGDVVIRKRIAELERVPVVVRLDKYASNTLQMGSSPRFGLYDTDFGWGEPVAVRSGFANHFDGKISAYPGKEGGGSVDLEICLCPSFMACLEMDEDFVCPLS